MTGEGPRPPRLSVVGVDREDARALLCRVVEEGLYPLDRMDVARALQGEGAPGGVIWREPEELEGEVFLVLGGDGTFLRAAHLARGRPLAGVNLGALGFLTLYGPDELARLLQAIRDRAFTRETRSALDIQIGKENLTAYNDLVVRSVQPSRLVRVRITVGEERLFDFFADGVIVATPTGSTAYNLSVMGPVLFPGVHGVVVTPLAAHTLSARPVVLPGQATLEIRAWSKHGEDILVLADGLIQRVLAPGSGVQVSVRPEGLSLLRTAWAPGFFDVLRMKLRWG